METWHALPILSREHTPDLDRAVMAQEEKGVPTASAISIVHGEYIHQKLLDGAVFHLRCASAFKNTEHQDAYDCHRALTALYKLKGAELNTKQAQSLDKELLEPDPEIISHPSDVFVLKIGK